MKYLAIFEDGTMKQVENIEEGDAQSVDGGYLDIVRFNAETGKYERYDPVVAGGNVLRDEWAEV